MTTPASPPLVLTGDDTTDEALAMLRATTEAIHQAQEQVTSLSAERRRLVLTLREQGRVKFSQIAEAANSTEQTVYKVHREAKDERRDLAHDKGDHQWCDAKYHARREAEAEVAAAAEQLDDDDEPEPAEPVALAG